MKTNALKALLISMLLLFVPACSAPPAPAQMPTAIKAAVAPTWWKPTGGYATKWQIQLSKPNPAFITGVQFYIYDGFDSTAAHVKGIKAKGGKSICYLSAGSWENWRSDASKFPASVKGKNLDGWPGEKWLDVRNLAVLKPIMEKRADLCKAKGFDAIDWDNVDGYTNGTGFPLSGNHQIAYNKMLSSITHARGMAVSLKNDVYQLVALEPFFDMAVNEECFDYNECAGYKVFSAKKKPVLNIQYSKLNCASAKSLNIASVKKNLSLDAARQQCG